MFVKCVIPPRKFLKETFCQVLHSVNEVFEGSIMHYYEKVNLSDEHFAIIDFSTWRNWIIALVLTAWHWQIETIAACTSALYGSPRLDNTRFKLQIYLVTDSTSSNSKMLKNLTLPSKLGLIREANLPVYRFVWSCTSNFNILSVETYLTLPLQNFLHVFTWSRTVVVCLPFTKSFHLVLSCRALLRLFTSLISIRFCLLPFNMHGSLIYVRMNLWNHV